MSLETVRAREQERWMPDSCSIQRVVRVSDGMGGQTETWSTVASPKCRVDPFTMSTPQERMVGEQAGDTRLVTIVLPHGTTIGAADRIVVGSHSYEVVTPLHGSFEANVRVVCKVVG